jgi:hypothetical protein
MAKDGITKEQVHAAAVQLKAKGDTVNINNIRRIVGTGSFTTIAKHLKAYLEEHRANSVSRGIPENLVVEFCVAIEEAERSARGESQIEIERLTSDNETLLNSLEEQVEENAKLFSEFQAMRTERDTVAGELHQLRLAYDRLSTEIDSTRDERDGAIQQAAQAKASLVEAMEYKSEAKASLLSEKNALAKAALLEGRLEEICRATHATAVPDGRGARSNANHFHAPAPFGNSAQIWIPSRIT